MPLALAGDALKCFSCLAVPPHSKNFRTPKVELRGVHVGFSSPIVLCGTHAFFDQEWRIDRWFACSRSRATGCFLEYKLDPVQLGAVLVHTQIEKLPKLSPFPLQCSIPETPLALWHGAAW